MPAPDDETKGPARGLACRPTLGVFHDLAAPLRRPLGRPPARLDRPAGGKTVEQLAESARKSVVVITGTGRDGKQQGLGTGFVVAADGLIATNLHVIGEARPITVRDWPTASSYDVDRRPRLRPQPPTWPSSASTPRTCTPLALGDSDDAQARARRSSPWATRTA